VGDFIDADYDVKNIMSTAVTGRFYIDLIEIIAGANIFDVY